MVIVDTTNPMAPVRRPITADSALMCPTGDKKIIALKAAVAGLPGDSLQARRRFEPLGDVVLVSPATHGALRAHCAE